MKTQMTVRQAGLRWLEDMGHLRETTKEGYSSVVRALGRHFGADAPLRALTPKALGQYFREERGRLAPSSYMTLRRITKLFTSWALRSGLLSKDSMTEIRSVRVQPAPPRILSEAEEALLIREAPRSVSRFILLAVETGLRRRALLSLRWEHVDLVEGRLSLPAELLKSGRTLRVPLSQRAWDCLREERKLQCQNFSGSQSDLVLPMAASTLSEAWRKVTKLCGLKGMKIHDLRKTFLTRCRRRNVPLEVAMALSDHRDYRVALGVYRLVDEDDLLRAVRAPAMGAVKEAQCQTTT